MEVAAALNARYTTETYMHGRMAVVWRSEDGREHVQAIRPTLPSGVHRLVEVCYPGELCLATLSSHSDLFWSAILLFDSIGTSGSARLDKTISAAKQASPQHRRKRMRHCSQ
jgi:hypothetical protein